jgi:predicted permease
MRHDEPERRDPDGRGSGRVPGASSPFSGRGLRRLLRVGSWRATDAKRDVDEEIRLHLELRVEALMAEGLDADAADAEARRRFAHDARTVRALYATARERNRVMRWRERWESVAQDTRYAARGLLRDRLLTGFVVLTLALGVGVNTTAFSLVDRLLVRDPAHVQDADSLVRLYARTELTNGPTGWLPFATYSGLREGMRTLASVGVYRPREALLGEGAGARRVRIGETLDGFFEVLGVRAARGRVFHAAEDRATDGALAVLSDELWHSDFGGDPAVIGRTLRVADAVHTIIGVAPAGFTGPQPWRVDVWTLADSRTANTVNWHVLGRLVPGGSIESASADGAAAHLRAAEQGPRWMIDADIFAGSIRLDDRAREPLGATMARWLAVVSAMILLVTLANVVNLLLVRVLRRRRELAIRVALGSGRGRVIRLLALEGVLLAFASGVVSLLVARVAEPVVRRALFAADAGWSFSVIDPRVVIVLVSVIAFAALIVGILPALHAGGPRLLGSLRSGAQPGGAGTQLRSALTVFQAAFSVVLLVGAGLFMRSFAEVRAVDLGVEADRVQVVRILDAGVLLEIEREFGRRAGAVYDYVRLEADLHRRLVDVVRPLPGVTSAAIAVGLPLDGGAFGAGIWIPGRDSVPSVPGLGPFVSVVSGGYFETVGTPIRAGRAFTDADRGDSEPVVIVGETMARVLWPSGDALGDCLHFVEATTPCARIVGIAADVRRTGLHGEDSYQLYIPLGQQRAFGGAALVVRPDPTSPVTSAALRQALLAAEPTVRAIEVQLLNEALEGDLRPLRLGLVTFGMSGVLALIVAVLGLYSLMASIVAWRTREIGVRMALGSTGGRIIRLIIGTGAGLAATGTVLGLGVALVAGRWLEPHLFRTSAADPLVLGGVTLAMFGAALVAGWLPSRRAVRISPTEALRAE